MDYEKIGLKCGIEIHQQLDTKKLFCNCSSNMREDAPHYTVKRRLRASKGESGDYDVAAKIEMMKDKTILYEGYFDSTCLVELDEEPPHEVNKDALKIALQVSMLLNMKINDCVEFMRKTIVNGSNTTGFQRTALFARNGAINTTEGKVRIATLCLEEDAAKIIKQEHETAVYRLDRLGIPLIEVATEPDIKTPEQCKETAERIGLLLRSTKVKRGLGTIRQDVNVSVTNGERVELKGEQDLRLLPTVVEYEVKRQMSLIEIANELKKKKIKFDEKITDVTELFRSCESKVIKDGLNKKDGVVYGIMLPSFKGLIGKEVQPGRRLGTEFSDRAKVYAGVGGLFHSDELPKYGITIEEIDKLKKVLGCLENDGFVIVCDSKNKCEIALNAVLERAKECLNSVPREVRTVRPDGTSSFMRPMPGAARMYPETDVPLIFPDIKNIKLPELIEEKIERFKKTFGLSDDLAAKIARSEDSILFEELVKINPKVKPGFIAETLVSYVPELTRNYKNTKSELITEKHFKDIFSALNKDIISKDAVLKIIVDIAHGRELDLKNYTQVSDQELTKILERIVSENKDAKINVLMNKANEILKGKAQGQKIMEIIKKIISLDKE